MKKTFLIAILGLLTIQLANADTQMAFKYQDGSLTTFLNDKYMRGKFTQNSNSEDSMPPGDMFGDFRSGKMYFIIEKEKLLIDTAAPAAFAGFKNIPGMPEVPKPPKLKITYKNKGAGKTISELKTIKYDIIVQGEKCFEYLLTKDKAYSAAMKKFDSINSDDGDAQDMCEEAEFQMDEKQYMKYGYPVKTVNANGKTTMLLTQFKTNVKAPKKYLSFPKGYQVTTMMEYAQKAMSEGKGQFK